MDAEKHRQRAALRQAVDFADDLLERHRAIEVPVDGLQAGGTTGHIIRLRLHADVETRTTTHGRNLRGASGAAILRLSHGPSMGAFDWRCRGTSRKNRRMDRDRKLREMLSQGVLGRLRATTAVARVTAATFSPAWPAGDRTVEEVLYPVDTLAMLCAVPLPVLRASCS